MPKSPAADSSSPVIIQSLSNLSTDQVKVSCTFDGQVHDIEIGGRPPGVLTSAGQGDHSLFFALVVHGFADILQGMQLGSKEGLSDLKGDKRSGAYDFISAIAILNPDQSHRDQLYQSIDHALDAYNSKRVGNGLISSMRTASASLSGQDLDQITYVDKEHQTQKTLFSKEFDGSIVAALQELNGRIIVESLQSMAKSLLAFYNKTPHSAYLPITGFRAPKCEGAEGSNALEFLLKLEKGKVHEDKLTQDNALHLKTLMQAAEEKLAESESILEAAKSEKQKLEQERKKSEEKGTRFRESAQQKHVDTLMPELQSSYKKCEADLEKIQETQLQEKFQFILDRTIANLSKLVFYPEITDPKALEDHQIETQVLQQSQSKSGIVTAFPRSNDPAQLTITLANTMHVVLAAYPNLVDNLNKLEGHKQALTQDNIISKFVDHIITQPYKVKSEPNGADVEISGGGWPSIASDQSQKEQIEGDVVFEVTKLQKLQKDSHYTKREGYSSRKSSESEEKMTDVEIEDALSGLKILRDRLIESEKVGVTPEVASQRFLEGIQDIYESLDMTFNMPEDLNGRYIETIEVIQAEFDKDLTKTKEGLDRIFLDQCKNIDQLEGEVKKSRDRGASL